MRVLDQNQIKNDLHNLNKVLSEEQQKLDFIDNEITELRCKVNTSNGLIKGYETEIAKKSSEDGKRLDHLETVNKDAFKGVQWLRENSNLFKRPVHEPIMMVLRPGKKL